MSAAAGGKPLADMARDLDVDHIVRGSVRRDERRVQVTVHLARPPDEDPQWSATFEADAPGLLEVQQRLATAIARQVQVQLVHDAGAPAPRPVDPAAHAALLEGRHFLQKRTADSVRKALAAFEGAVAREPDLARAHVGLAHCHAFHLMGHGSKAEALARARAAVDRALALDDRLAEAHTVLAVLQCADWQFAAAERSFRWAIALDPNAPGARHWLAMFPLVASGRFEEALAELRRARRLDPLSLIISADIAGVYCMTRQFERAVTQCTASLHLEPAFARAHVYLGWARVGLGRHDAAVIALETAARLDVTPWTRAWLGHAYGAAGRAADARGILRGFLEGPDADRGESPFFAGVVATGLGDADQALASFERAVDQRSLWVATLAALPPLDGLRGDRRFDALLQRIREAAWPGGARGS
jgi:tetratricopeptide (TPR) repeat protein